MAPSQSAVATVRALRDGRSSVQQRIEAALARAEDVEGTIRAFVDVDRSGALRTAQALDAAPERRYLPLYGVPVAIKELFDVRGLRCTWGSKLHADRIATDDAVVTQRLRAAGAVVLGTTVSTEYAIARAGPTRNPHDPRHTPGGSSSGSAAAVAAGVVPLAIGSQTVGSIVRPAVYCGVFGLKPTRGAISLEGAMPLSPYLDHAGLLAGDLADIELGFESLRDFPSQAQATSLARQVLLVRDPYTAEMEPASRRALQRAVAAFEAVNLPVVEVTLDRAFEQSSAILGTILAHDLARLHGADYRRAPELMSAALRRLFELGMDVDQEDYDRAVAHAESLRHRLSELMTVDSVVLATATPGTAPVHDDAHGTTGSNRLQGLWTMVGTPALAVPCGRFEGMPIGVQLVACPGQEALLFDAARHLQRQLGNG